MDKTTEFRQFRLAMQLAMVKAGKSPAEIRAALKEADKRYREAKEREGKK